MACCRSERTSEKDSESGDSIARFDSLRKDFKEIYYRFPAPNEMFSYLDSVGLQFDRTLLHPYKDIDNYLETFDQALNLGIYNADLAYISLFQRYKESMDYLQTVYILSDRLRISAAFDKKLLYRIENNIRNTDSLEAVSDAALNSIISYLSRNDKEDVFALISMGGFLEFMYLSLAVSGEYSPENIVVTKIADQKLVYENILKFSQQYKSESNIEKMLQLVTPLTEFYNLLVTESGKSSVSKAADGKLIFGGSKKIHLSHEEFNKLKDIVASIRLKITTAKI